MTIIPSSSLYFRAKDDEDFEEDRQKETNKSEDYL